jgi:predicted small secreted protein
MSRAHRPETPMTRTAAFLALAVCLLSACNTMQGVGQDMSAAGDAVSSTAQDVQRQM